MEVPEEVMTLSGARLIARNEKDWGKADKLRDEILKMGWMVKDVGDGFKLEEK